MENEYQYTVSIVTATLNEVENIKFFIDGLDNVVKSFNLIFIKELVIVDDGSIDGTVEEINRIKQSTKTAFEIKLIERHKKMGTVDAQISGINSCKGRYALVMDADLQHPFEFIPDFLKYMDTNIDVVIGSRYTEGGNIHWPTNRAIISKSATLLAHLLIRTSRKIKDPLSGYFLVKTNLIPSLEPYPDYYKALLYIISYYPRLNIKETPISIYGRLYGESKITKFPAKMIVHYIKELLTYRHKMIAANIREYKVTREENKTH